MTYSYEDGGLYYFMDNETYEQIPLNESELGEAFKLSLIHISRPLSGRCIVRLLRHLQLVAEHLLRSVPVRLSPCAAIQREWQIRMLPLPVDAERKRAVQAKRYWRLF